MVKHTVLCSGPLAFLEEHPRQNHLRLDLLLLLQLLLLLLWRRLVPVAVVVAAAAAPETAVSVQRRVAPRGAVGGDRGGDGGAGARGVRAGIANLRRDFVLAHPMSS